ncbi:zinc ribbon domain-containing protein [Bifidobacterium oedipodis]|uniref:Zinc-ribbon domain-containing protein n=1 Tax=Bifidobacterium oedipodis TaxID=2675322 RepID=A0A7Y0EST6_9BIFI|nr:zinc ribbon domain-containing protein [Bifidobacterium sp. DSM 109957]NMM94691.1 hypothetical protein [Bifidobacterium sp. DSM 109957]
MFCRHCGTGMPTDSKFCPKCGRPVDAPDTNTNAQINKPAQSVTDPTPIAPQQKPLPAWAHQTSNNPDSDESASSTGNTSHKRLSLGAIIGIIITIIVISALVIGVIVAVNTKPVKDNGSDDLDTSQTTTDEADWSNAPTLKKVNDVCAPSNDVDSLLAVGQVKKDGPYKGDLLLTAPSKDLLEADSLDSKVLALFGCVAKQLGIASESDLDQIAAMNLATKVMQGPVIVPQSDGSYISMKDQSHLDEDGVHDLMEANRIQLTSSVSMVSALGQGAGVATFVYFHEDISNMAASDDSIPNEEQAANDNDTTAATSTPLSVIVNQLNTLDWSGLAGQYCRNDGACLTFNSDGSVARTMTDGTDNTNGSYPFSSKLQGLTLQVAWQSTPPQTSAAINLGIRGDANLSCPNGTEGNAGTCNSSDGSYTPLAAWFYYVAAGSDLGTAEQESFSVVRGSDPDMSRSFLVFQQESGSNGPFEIGNDFVFYKVS